MAVGGGKEKGNKLWLSLLIGAGIILTPVLLLLAWADMKETAGISALFITVNSVVGLLGNVMIGMELGQDIVWL